MQTLCLCLPVLLVLFAHQPVHAMDGHTSAELAQGIRGLKSMSIRVNHGMKRHLKWSIAVLIYVRQKTAPARTGIVCLRGGDADVNVMVSC